ncbi:hypothetical protein DOY81_010247 [Sarcophaga bullata]|nr:hypothetical protein DOY81_010247 [Sarcophaga bullata]
MEKPVGSKQGSEAKEEIENDYSNTSSNVSSPKVEVPRLKLKKINNDRPDKRVYRIVLTGGPCGGKTTGQSRLCTFFENLGWKVSLSLYFA